MDIVWLGAGMAFFLASFGLVRFAELLKTED